MNDDIINGVTEKVEAIEETSDDISTLPSTDTAEKETYLNEEEKAESEEEKTEKSEENEEIPSEEPQCEKDVQAMREELEMLRKELNEKISAFERMGRDIEEFSELFPEKNINAIPDTVWESVKAGIPLAAAYALYERKNAVRENTALRANEANSARATGAIGRSNTENFYTPDEVRAMSRAEVKKNYSKILESMKKWN